MVQSPSWEANWFAASQEIPRNLLTYLLTYLHTYLLTAWCRVPLEKLTGLQLVMKFPAFHGTRRFITALTSVRQLSVSWASPIQSMYPHPTSWRSILILSNHLCLRLPTGLFPSGFPTKTLYTPSPHPYAPHAQPISFEVYSGFPPPQYTLPQHNKNFSAVWVDDCPDIYGCRIGVDEYSSLLVYSAVSSGK